MNNNIENEIIFESEKLKQQITKLIDDFIVSINSKSTQKLEGKMIDLEIHSTKGLATVVIEGNVNIFWEHPI